eukprot:gene11490-13357_t
MAVVPPSLFRRNGGGGVNTFEERMIGQLRADIEAGKNLAADDWKYFNEPVIDSILGVAGGRACLYCGLILDEYTVSFDRIDNNNCHTASNVVLSCAPCNITRSNQFTAEEFVAVCDFLRQFRANPNVLRPPVESLRTIVTNSPVHTGVLQTTEAQIHSAYIDSMNQKFGQALSKVIAESGNVVKKAKVDAFVESRDISDNMLDPAGLNLYCFKSAADAFDQSFGHYNFNTLFNQYYKDLV